MARPRKPDGELDLDLEDLPGPARWREWMGRVEAVIFASTQPVLRESLARVVGKACNLDLIIDDIRDELSGRPYELVSVAGGWSFRTKLGFGDAIRAAMGGPQKARIVALECACPDGNCVFSADHPRGAVAVFGTGGFRRRDRLASRRRVHRRRAAQPDARRALRLCHDARVLGGIRVREFPRPAGDREARGRGAARPDERETARWRGIGFRATGSPRAEGDEDQPEEDAA